MELSIYINYFTINGAELINQNKLKLVIFSRKLKFQTSILI